MLFSIIVPIYNVEKYLKQCVDSVLSQTFADFELILVDDGSKDGCPKICDEYAKKDSRIKVVHKKNGGVNIARKTALTYAKGEYVAFVDADDWIAPTLLQEAKDVIEKYKVDVFCFDYSEIYGDKEVQRHTFLEEGFYGKNKLEELVYPSLIRNSFGQRFFPNLWTKIIKKELYEQFQNYSKEAIKIGEDESVALPCVFFAESIYISRKIFYYYRQNMQSATKSRSCGYPWSDILSRANIYCTLFPMEKFGFEEQVNRLIVHELFIFAVSHFRTNKKYKESKKEILNEFEKAEYQNAIDNCFYRNNFKEKLAAFAIRHKKIFWIYLWAKLK